MKSKWSDHEAAAVISRYHNQGYNEDIAIRTYTTRLLGGDPELVLHGGVIAVVLGVGRVPLLCFRRHRAGTYLPGRALPHTAVVAGLRPRGRASFLEPRTRRGSSGRSAFPSERRSNGVGLLAHHEWGKDHVVEASALLDATASRVGSVPAPW